VEDSRRSRLSLWLIAPNESAVTDSSGASTVAPFFVGTDSEVLNHPDVVLPCEFLEKHMASIQ
jgi:hypothetical protein